MYFNEKKIQLDQGEAQVMEFMVPAGNYTVYEKESFFNIKIHIRKGVLFEYKRKLWFFAVVTDI